MWIDIDCTESGFAGGRFAEGGSRWSSRFSVSFWFLSGSLSAGYHASLTPQLTLEWSYGSWLRIEAVKRDWSDF